MTAGAGGSAIVQRCGQLHRVGIFHLDGDDALANARARLDADDGFLRSQPVDLLQPLLEIADIHDPAGSLAEKLRCPSPCLAVFLKVNFGHRALDNEDTQFSGTEILRHQIGARGDEALLDVIIGRRSEHVLDVGQRQAGALTVADQQLQLVCRNALCAFEPDPVDINTWSLATGCLRQQIR